MAPESLKACRVARLEIADFTPEAFLASDAVLVSRPTGELRIWNLASGLAQLPTPAGYRPVGRTAAGDVVTVTESGSVVAFSWPEGSRRWSSDRLAGIWPAVSRDGAKVAILTADRQLVLLRSRDGTVEGDVACASGEGARLVWESSESVLIEGSSPHGGALLRGTAQTCTVAAAEGGVVAS